MGLLDMFEEGEDATYLVGGRPLNSAGKGSLFGVLPWKEHRHFIASNGVDNFGFTDTGEFSEPMAVLKQYEPTEKYGAKRYDAGLLDLARQNWHANHDAIDEVADNMGLWDEGLPNIHRDYNAFANNCQHYVDWLDGDYERMLRGYYK
jgi:hypothetical protein